MAAGMLPVLVALVCLLAAGQARAALMVQSLGTFVPESLNNSDQIAGDIPVDGPTAIAHAAVWSGGVLTPLPELGGTDSSNAYSISAAGRIVGDDHIELTGDVHGVQWDVPAHGVEQIGPFVPVSQDFTVLNGVDTAGDVVGTTLTASGSLTGFLYNGSERVAGAGDLGMDTGSTTVGAVTPDGSLLLGSLSTSSGSSTWLWPGDAPSAHGTLLDITPNRSGAGVLAGGVPFGPLTQNDLASNGSVLGHKGSMQRPPFFVRLLSGAELTVNGLTAANAVNASNVVVGTMATGTMADPVHAAIWNPTDGTVTDLNKLLPDGSGFELVDALAINDEGDIAGIAAHGGQQVGFLMSGPHSPQVTGQVVDRNGKAVPGIALALTGTDDDGHAVSQTASTNATGTYLFTVNPGNYKVKATGDAPTQNGGSLTSSSCAGTADDNTCTLTHAAAGSVLTASFTYTLCASSDRMPNGKPLTGCPIIFVPGFLGTRIACDGAELWPNLPGIRGFADMELAPDGATDAGAPGTCKGDAGPVQGPAGLVTSAGGIDVYGSTAAFLASIAPGRYDVFTYDWRKSPELAVPALDNAVDSLLSNTGATRVVIMAHSMGGLVTRAYTDDPAHADKVERVLTLGTPYWGAPKAHFALLEGDTDTPAFSALDIFTSATNLQRFARNSAGIFWLNPSNRYGPWLTVSNLNGGRPLVGSDVDRWIRTLGGTTALADQARGGHELLDGFKTNGIDWQVMVGTGLPTVTAIQITSNGIDDWATLDYGSGDETVPALSATQGAFNGGAPLGDNVPIHYVCGVPHISLGGNPGVDNRVQDFLLEGKDIPDSPDDNCPYTGTEFDVFHLNLRAGSPAVVSAAGRSMSVAEAQRKRLVTVYEYGGRDIIVTSDRDPVTLRLQGSGLALQVRRISSHHNGPTLDYGPLSGTVDAVGHSGVVTRKGHKLKSHRPAHRRPVTVAHIRRHGKKYAVTLTAHDPIGVGATFYRIGHAASRRYTKPLVLTASQVRSLRFASISDSGDLERLRRAPHLPRRKK